MRRFFALCLIASGLLAPTIVASPALAQSDWSVQRDPFDRRLVAKYKAILERNPGDRAALRKLQSLYRRHRSIKQLMDEYQAALAKKPNSFAAAMVLGHLYQGESDAANALEHYERAAAIRPDSADVQVALGELYRRSGKREQARTAYQRALAGTRSSSTRKEVLRALAELATDAGDIGAAKRFYEQYIALAPRDVEAHLALGDVLAQHGQHAAAIQAFSKAERRLRSDPARQVEVIARIGAAHEAAGDEEAAVREYRRAMSKVRQGYYLRKELTGRIIDIYRRRQSLADLVARYETSWPSGRRGHFEWDVLARLYEEIGDQEKALAAFRKATQKAPYELDTQRRLIALLENSGREEEAVQQYERVVRVAPGEPRFQLELAERYWRRDKSAQALSLLAKMERRFPGDAGVYAAIADLYTRWGKGDLALRAYARLVQIEPGESAHLINLGEQYFQRNDKTKAEEVWRRLIDRPTAANYARLGEVYAEHDMLPKALAMYNKAIALEPSNPEHYKGRASVHERSRSFRIARADWAQVLKLLNQGRGQGQAQAKAGGVTMPARREARSRIVSLLKREHSRALDQQISLWQRSIRTKQSGAEYGSPQELGFLLVEALMHKQRYAEARSELQRMLAVDESGTLGIDKSKVSENELEAMHLLVKVYKQELEYDRAVALLLVLAELSPGREREYYTEIAELKTADRKDDEAIHYAQKALETSPRDPVAHQRLAERYTEMQQFDKAIAAYEKSIELDKRNFRTYFALARLQTYVGQAGKAAELYRDVLRQASDEDLLLKAGREAIALEEMTGTLGELERVLAPLAFTFAHKPVYRRILVQLYGRYVTPHLVEQWNKGTPAERAAARAELDRLGTHGLKPLLEALSDETDAAQQRIAVEVLGYLGNKGAAAPLVRMAQTSRDAEQNRRPAIGTLTPMIGWEMRVEALIAAGRLGDPRTIDALTKLSKHSEKSMREAAVFALGRTGSRAAVPALLEAVETRSEALQALGCLGLANVGDPQALPQVSAVVRNRRSNDAARAACAYALGHIGDRRATPLLLDALRYGNGEAQRLAAWALGQMEVREAVPMLLRAYFSRHEHVRQAVGWALARIMDSPKTPGKSEPPPLHIEFSGSSGNLLAYDAEAAVRRLPGQHHQAVPSPTVLIGHGAELTAGLREALTRHRDMLVRVLQELASSTESTETGHIDLGPLTKGLAALPPAQQTQVRDTLGRVARSIVPQLAELVQHRDPKVRALALAVLAKIDAPATKELLLAGMDDSVPAVQLAAMRATATYVRIHDKHGAELAQAVSAQLTADSWRGRSEAAQSLGYFGKYASGNTLIAALQDSNAYVREQAALALGRLSQARRAPGAAAGVTPADAPVDALVDALIRASTDELPAVRMAVVRSLAAIDGPTAMKRLGELGQSDPDPAVARAARAAAQSRKN